jgi:transcriptional regulator with XRE-family HTH domain
MSKGLDTILSTDRRFVEKHLTVWVNLVRKSRRDKGWTQDQLAEKVGLSLQTLQSIECGRRIPSLPVLLVLSKKLDIEINFNQ